MNSTYANGFDLEPGEKQLWTGRPRQGLMLRRSDALLIPFSLLWGGFAVFWEVGVLSTPAPGFFAIWGIPFVLMGVYIVIGRFFVDSWRRGRTSYGLTSDRVIIQSSSSLKSLPLRTLTDVTLSERADGTGTITFGSNPFSAFPFGGPGWPGMPQTPSFEQIPDARRVYAQIRQAQQAPLSRAS